MNNDVKHILIGGQGFIARSLREKLNQHNNDVLVVQRKVSQLTIENRKNETICSFDAIEELINKIPNSCNVIVYNCIAYYDPTDALRNTYDNFKSNFLIPLRIISALQNRKSLFINLNTFYGINREMDVQTVSIRYTYDTLYTRSKNYFVQEAFTLSRSTNMTFIDLVLPAIFGYDSRKKVINTLVRAALSKSTLRLDGGSQIWDYLYVKDLISAITSVTSNYLDSGMCLKSASFLLGTDQGVKVSDIAKMINAITNSEYLSFTEIERADDINFYVSNSQNFRNKFKWEPRYTFITGLKEVILKEKINSD